MKKAVISSEKAPKAIGPYSQAILSKNKYKLELSGQIGADPKIGKLVKSEVGSQTEQTLNNIGGILSELGWTFSNITKSRVFLANMSDYQTMNDIYSKRFKESPPARVAVAVKGLPLGALVEIDCVAEGNEISEKAKVKYKL